MAKKQNNKNDIIKDINEDTDQIKKFVIILIGVALVSVLIYFVSTNFLIKDGVKEENTTPETISYSNVLVGNVFNRPYDEYYVLAYDPDSLEASIYSALLNSVDEKKGKIYFLDLSLEINKKQVGENSNKNATNPNELSLKEPTLIKIKNKKIDKYLETKEEIEAELK